MNISDLLIKFNQEDLPESFVAIACKIENKDATHAAILIRLNSINYLHHFPGAKPPEIIDNFNEDGWYIYKILDAINIDDESEVGSFLQYCRRICKNSVITYGYIADNSSYSDRGPFISRIGLPEFGTCVSFCANTLSNTLLDLEVSYFDLDDWDDSDLIKWVDDWAIKQATLKYPDLDWHQYNTFKKRIKPLEFLTSSFIKEYPITKSKIHEFINDVKMDIESKFN